MDKRDKLRDTLERFRVYAQNRRCPGESCLYCELDLYPDFIREILAVTKR